MGLLHMVQLLQRGKKSISAYGTQNKEAKNKMQRDFFESFSRKDDNLHALEDTFLRDTLTTSFVIRSKGNPIRTKRCSGCKSIGHSVNKCPHILGGDIISSQPSKFLDSQDFSDPLLHVRDGAEPNELMDDDTSASNTDSENDENQNERIIETPVKSKAPAQKRLRLEED